VVNTSKPLKFNNIMAIIGLTHTLLLVILIRSYRMTQMNYTPGMQVQLQNPRELPPQSFPLMGHVKNRLSRHNPYIEH